MKYLLYTLVIGGLLLGTWACTDDFEDLNTNPNGVTQVSTGLLLTGAQKAAMDYTWDEWWNGYRGNQLAQFWASNQYSDESRYAFRPGITNDYWAVFYAGSSNADLRNGGGLEDLNEIIRLCEEDPAFYGGFGDIENQIAVANIMRAWIFQMITDCWGPAPFTEANQGGETPMPGYNSQRDIYIGLLTMLENASNNINVQESGPDGDVIYGGDMVRWKKFANSLRLRVALRMADTDEAPMAQSHAEAAVTAGVFESNDDSALFPYMGAYPNNNPINEAFKTRNDFCASNTMIDLMKSLDDPRMDKYFNPAESSGEFVGMAYGLAQQDAAAIEIAEVSQQDERVLSASFPGIYLGYPAVEFMLAEAVERGYNVPGTAEEHYNHGIEASMQFWNVEQSEIDGYIASDEVDYNTQLNENSWREVIGKQKWLALYLQGMEGWIEWRRLDFGILQLPESGNLMGEGIPKRLLYPRDEQTLNQSSYSDAVNNLLGGPDALDTRVWWDVN